MFGVARGYGEKRSDPVCVHIRNLTAARSLDQIHTDICYQNVPVKIIATHAGTSFGQAGSTTILLLIWRVCAAFRI